MPGGVVRHHEWFLRESVRPARQRYADLRPPVGGRGADHAPAVHGAIRREHVPAAALAVRIVGLKNQPTDRLPVPAGRRSPFL